MSRRVETIGPEDPIRAAAEAMRALNVGALPVCDGDRLRGMITDRDIAIRAVADGKMPDTCKVREVMTSPIVTCFEDDEVADAEKRMVGIVSVDDLATAAPEQRIVVPRGEELHP